MYVERLGFGTEHGNRNNRGKECVITPPSERDYGTFRATSTDNEHMRREGIVSPVEHYILTYACMFVFRRYESYRYAQLSSCLIVLVHCIQM